MPNRNAETELEETEKKSFNCQMKREHSNQMPQGLSVPSPSPLRGSEESPSVQGTGCDQLMDFPDWLVMR